MKADESSLQMTCTYRPISSCRDFRHVQDVIDVVEEWSVDNFLNLNPSKCKYMLISRKRIPSIPDEPLILDDLPYKGLMLSSTLVLYYLKTCHGLLVQAACLKAKKVLGLLYRKFYGCANTDTLVQLYISLVRPRIEYASPARAPHMAKDIHAIKSVQKFACRMVTHNWNFGYHELLSLTELPTLERRLELKLGQLFKIVHDLFFFLIL